MQYVLRIPMAKGESKKINVVVVSQGFWNTKKTPPGVLLMRVLVSYDESVQWS
jgi:hypothetical protein